MLRMEKGVAKIPERRMRGDDGRMRHGDSAIAGALAWCASQTSHQEYGYQPMSALRRHPPDLDRDEEEDRQPRARGFFSQRLRFRGRGTY
jgi:phage FluMu gp28-like protein